MRFPRTPPAAPAANSRLSLLQEDLLIHGDSMYDIIDKQDHAAVQAELVRGSTSASPHEEDRLFLCRMNVSRNARRQMRFGDQKVRREQSRMFLGRCNESSLIYFCLNAQRVMQHIQIFISHSPLILTLTSV